MSSWSEVEADDPDFAARVRAIFDARKHKVLATLRRDGSPRVSGIEIEFEGGEVLFGIMPGSHKGADLERDPRMAVHATSDDPPVDNPGGWAGDAKISGHAVPAGTVKGFDPPAARLRVDIDEVVLTRVADAGDQLVIESWHPGRGLERLQRA